MKSNKKAFTIVELVIVIAVIAILAAVLIPTFSNMIKRSKVSADQQLIRNLNSALAADLKDHKTMTDALAAATEFGYDVSKINKSATDNEILWDSKNDAFCYFESDKNDITYIPETTLTVPKDQVKAVDYWIIAKTPSDKYSTYLYNTELTTIENLKTGLDVGNETISSITYVGKGSAQSVVIRTNGGTLTINAPADTVNHYGDADSVNIVSIASASYHENGRVPFIQISKGRIEIEATGDVNGIHVANVQVVDSKGNITKTANTFTGDVVLTLNGNEVKLTRDTIGTNISEAVLVCAVDVSDSAATEYIWLVGDGTIESSKVVVTASTTYDSTKTVTKDTASAAAVAIANNAENTGTAESPVYTAHEAGVNAADAEVASALKGTGTETDPFLVYDYATMQKISDFYDKEHYYFAVAIEKTDNGTIDCSGWEPVNMYGCFDGKGVQFINLDECLFLNVKAANNIDVVVKNFDCTFDVLTDNDGAVIGCVRHADSVCNIYLSKVYVHGKFISTYAASAYIGWGNGGNGNYVYNFTDCVADITLAATDNTVAGFVYHPYAASDAYYINNSAFIGRALVAGSWGPTQFNAQGVGTTSATYTQEFIDQYSLSTLFENAPSAAGTYTFTRYTCKLTANKGSVATQSISGNLPEVGGVFETTKVAGATKALVTYSFGPNPGNLYSTFISENIDLTTINVGDTFTTSLVKYYKIAINGKEVVSGTDHGSLSSGINDEYNVFNLNRDGLDGTVHTANVKIVQFDTDANTLVIWTVTIPYSAQ